MPTEDVVLIAKLRACREKAIHHARKLRKQLADAEIAKKFECSESFVRNVPPWDGE